MSKKIIIEIEVSKYDRPLEVAEKIKNGLATVGYYGFKVKLEDGELVADYE